MNMSGISQQLSKEDWQDLVAWDGEIYDTFFQGNVGYTTPPVGSHESFSGYAQSATSEQQYEPSSATSVLDGPPSDYAISAAPSIADGPSSFGQVPSWPNELEFPSFSTPATSPLVGRDGRAYQGSFDACEEDFPSQRATSSFADSFGSTGSYHTAAASFFNPNIASSPHAFSGLDVSASQAFANVGTWADPAIAPIPELDHEGAIPIPIPQNNSQSFSNTFSSQPWSQEAPQHQTRPRAITIPQTNQHGPGVPHQQWSQPVPPLLSVSPDAQRLSRSATLSKGIAKSEPRRSRNRLTTSSPTSNISGWVSYHHHPQNNRMVPSGTEGNRGKRPRGRAGALTPEQRSHAALMRHVGSCSNCKRRKERCDTGTPCRSCLDHYKGDLVNNPCRDRLLSDLSGAFLAERLGWHPTARALECFVAPNGYDISTDTSYNISLNFGFGPALNVPVHALHVEDTDALIHDHVIYSWPPGSSSEEMHTHAVLPAVLTPDAVDTLRDTLDSHLSLLVASHFRAFPLYCSPLRILRQVYIFYRSLPTTSSYSRILRQALKLLVLVHIGGDLTLPPASRDPVLAQLMRNTMSLSEPPTIPAPCFIRAQFGSVMPSLALSLMKEVLRSLEQLFLTRECQEWPIALATTLVVLMTVESIQYHASKRPYHASYDGPISWTQQERDNKYDDEGVKVLLRFYSACFPGCHARLKPDWEGEGPPLNGRNARSFGSQPEDIFVESVRDAIRQTGPGYLQKKASEERGVSENMEFYFDRLVARLLVSKV